LSENKGKYTVLSENEAKYTILSEIWTNTLRICKFQEGIFSFLSFSQSIRHDMHRLALYFMLPRISPMKCALVCVYRTLPYLNSYFIMCFYMCDLCSKR
jgi:hypothetical protein